MQGANTNVVTVGANASGVLSFNQVTPVGSAVLSDYGTVANTFVVPVSGPYRIDFTGTDGTGGAATVVKTILRNGAVIATAISGQTNSISSFVASNVLTLSAGDQITFRWATSCSAGCTSVSLRNLNFIVTRIN